MRFLELNNEGELQMTEDFIEEIPHYAILSHTWGPDAEEVNFTDMETGHGKNKPGYQKLLFCARQARRDGLLYSWVDTCCINKNNHPELSEAITCMFRWYQNAVDCYVYLADVPDRDPDHSVIDESWAVCFRQSKWFKRGWTLQELLAPRSVKFYSQNGRYLGNKQTLEQQVHQTTEIPISALRGAAPDDFAVEERMKWTESRRTKRKEDRAYCLLGIFGVFMPLIYGEGDNAFVRLQEEIEKRLTKKGTSGSRNQQWRMELNDSTVSMLNKNRFAQSNIAKLKEDIKSIQLDKERLENISFTQRCVIGEVVVQNCRNACFEFYKNYHLWKASAYEDNYFKIMNLFRTSKGHFPNKWLDFSLKQWISKIECVLSNGMLDLDYFSIEPALEINQTLKKARDIERIRWSETRVCVESYNSAFQTAIKLCNLLKCGQSADRIVTLSVALIYGDGKIDTTFLWP